MLGQSQVKIKWLEPTYYIKTSNSGKEEDFQYQNGFHQENGTTNVDTGNPVTNGHKHHYPMSTRVWILDRKEEEKTLCNIKKILNNI